MHLVGASTETRIGLLREGLIREGIDAREVCIDAEATRGVAIIKAVDSTAAGDIFTGALAVALGEGMDLDAAARFAVRAATLSVKREGAQTSIPRRSELQ